MESQKVILGMFDLLLRWEGNRKRRNKKMQENETKLNLGINSSYLGRKNVTAEELASITRRKWEKLSYLSLIYSKIGDKGISHLQAFPHLQ